MACKRYNRLRPERSFHMPKDMIERLMLDNMADQVFVQQSVKARPRRPTRARWTTSSIALVISRRA